MARTAGLEAVRPSRRRRRRSRSRVAVRRRASLRRRIERGLTAPAHCKPGEAHARGARARRMLLVRGRDGMTRLARHTRGVCGVCAARGPRRIACTMTRTTTTGSVAEVDLAVHVQAR